MKRRTILKCWRFSPEIWNGPTFSATLWMKCSKISAALMGSCARELLPPGQSPAGYCLPFHAALVWKCDPGPEVQTSSCGGASFDPPPSGNRKFGKKKKVVKPENNHDIKHLNMWQKQFNCKENYHRCGWP